MKSSPLVLLSSLLLCAQALQLPQLPSRRAAIGAIGGAILLPVSVKVLLRNVCPSRGRPDRHVSATAQHVLAMPRHCTGLIRAVSAACGWPGCLHTSRASWRCRCCQMGHRSSCAHAQLTRKPGDTMHVFALDPLVSSRGLDVWDTVLAGSYRWGSRKFTIPHSRFDRIREAVL